MNKEVKEIIQKIEDVRDNPAVLDDDGWCDNWMVMSVKECNILLDYINQLESAFDEIRVIVSKSLFKTDLVELCRMKNQIKEILDKVGGPNE